MNEMTEGFNKLQKKYNVIIVRSMKIKNPLTICITGKS